MFNMTESLTRRSFLAAGAVSGAMLPFADGFAGTTAKPFPTSAPPVIHMTDLYHPHGDPDDHFDLACVFSLASQGLIDLKGVCIDYPPSHRSGDPDVLAVAQLNRICGLNVPVVVGSSRPMADSKDTLPDLPLRETGSIRWIIETLQKSDRPVAISVVGSATDLALAARREPDLFREKCAGVYLDAGATHQKKPEDLEFNVKLNPAAYAAMFDLPCPLYWFPCWHTTEDWQTGEWGTFYWMPHRRVFEGVKTDVCGYFWYMFSQAKETLWLRAISTPPPEAEWAKILDGRRAMWSSAGFLLMSDLSVTKAGKIVPLKDVGEDALFRMEPVKARCEENGRLQWELSEEPTGRFVFHILDVANYPAAMTEAVRSLLLAFPG